MSDVPRNERIYRDALRAMTTSANSVVREMSSFPDECMEMVDKFRPYARAFPDGHDKRARMHLYMAMACWLEYLIDKGET